MRTFTNEKKISSIKRQVYTGDKSTFVSVASNKFGYFRPLTEDQSSVNGLQYGTGFSLMVENSVDVREADRITIDGVEYVCRGVGTHDRGSVPFKRCLITKPTKS